MQRSDRVRDALGYRRPVVLWDPLTGEPVYSFAMLTINTNGHAPMRNRHRPTDVKRMVAILPRGSSGDWLDTSAEQTMAFMRAGPTSKSAGTA